MLSVFIETNSPSNIIIAGNLNISLAPNEKKGGVFGKDHFQEIVEELIQVYELSDINPKRGDILGQIIEWDQPILQLVWTGFSSIVLDGREFHYLI